MLSTIFKCRRFFPLPQWVVTLCLASCWPSWAPAGRANPPYSTLFSSGIQGISRYLKVFPNDDFKSRLFNLFISCLASWRPTKVVLNIFLSKCYICDDSSLWLFFVMTSAQESGKRMACQRLLIPTLLIMISVQESGRRMVGRRLVTPDLAEWWPLCRSLVGGWWVRGWWPRPRWPPCLGLCSRMTAF